MSFGEDVAEIVTENRNGLLSTDPSWERVDIGDVAEILNGYPFKSAFFSKDQGQPLIRIRDVFSDQTDAMYNGPEVEGFWIESGDLIIGMDGDFNCARWQGPRALLNQRVCAVYPNERFYLTAFLTYVLPGYLKSINDHTSSVTVKHLSSKTVKSLPVPLPPFNEQRRIVEKIDALMERRGRAKIALYAIPALLDQYRQSVLAAAFRGDLTADWRAQNLDVQPASKLLERIRTERRQKWEKAELAKMRAKGKEPKNDKWKGKYIEPEINGVTGRFDVPTTWQWVSVELLCPVVQYGSSAKTNDDESGVPVLRMGNIINGELDFTNLRFLPHDHDEFPLLLLDTGDVLFNRTNSAELVGKCAVYQGSPEPCSFASYLIRLKTVGMQPELLSGYINSPYGRAWVASVVSQQVGQANVNGTKLKVLATPLPPQAEQAEILRRIDQANRMIITASSTFDETSEQLSTLNQSILAKAFRGELVPQDPNDEPASVLLERIRAEREASAANKPKRRSRRAAK